MTDCPVEYVTGGIEASDGSVWVIGERSGIYRHWKGKESQSGAADWMCADYYRGYPQTQNFYGIAEDKQGRIWVGTDNQGVVVFNGTSWKQYDRENALPGERIFDINVSPVTGEVAVATSVGVVIYNPKDESWKTFTRGSGLYADQVESLCYDSKGDLWLAYACGGVGKGSPKDKYSKWELVQAPWYRDANQYVRQPQEATGEGLPSNLCNVILTGPSNYVWVGTNDGIGFTSNGKAWKFVRGEDYWSKNKGVYGSTVTGRAPLLGRKLLPEDYVTSMLMTPKGLWIGFREKGAVLAKPGTLEPIEQAVFPKTLTAPWVTGFIPLSSGTVYAMTYGNGLLQIQEGKKGTSNKIAQKNNGEEQVGHPQEPAVPEWASLKEKAKELLEHRDSEEDKSPAVFWKEDWATQGDWCQRYGTNFAILCGANFEGLSEFFWAGFKSDVRIGCRLGCNLHGKKGGVRSAMGWLNKAEDGSVLFNPERCLRTKGTWMDATIGEGVDGSDLWLVVQLEKQGKYELSLYFYDAGIEQYPVLRKRDNLIEVRKYKSSYTNEMSLNLYASREKDKDGKDPLEEETALILKEPVLARARVKEISGCGVYKTFLLDGSGIYYVRLARNSSQGARISGVFASKIGSEGLLSDVKEDKLFRQYAGIALAPVASYKSLSSKEREVVSMWGGINNSAGAKMLSSAFEWSLNMYRREKKSPSTAVFAPVMRWGLKLWNEEERNQFRETLLKSWYTFQEKEKGPYITEDYSKESPRVLPISMRDVEIMEYLKIDWKDYVSEDGKEGRPLGELRERLDKISDEELNDLKKKYEEQQMIQFDLKNNNPENNHGN